MAKAFIREYKTTMQIAGDPLGAAQEPGIDQIVDFSPPFTSVASEQFAADTKFIRIAVDTTCSFVLGYDPTATVDTAYLPKDGIEYFGVVPGQKIAFIVNP